MGTIIEMPVKATWDLDNIDVGRVPSSGVIIQARMTSRRFPGKSLALLDGVPVIGRVIERCFRISNVEQIFVAVPVGPEQQPLRDYIAEKYPVVKVVDGSEENVLARYYQIASKHHLNFILRITGDCPFIDPNLCASVLWMLFDKQLDYCSNIYPIRTFYTGLDCEAFSYDCLEAAMTLAESPYDLEHVTHWMQQCAEAKKGIIQNKRNQSKELNLCVDYPEDIARLEALLKRTAEGATPHVQ